MNMNKKKYSVREVVEAAGGYAELSYELGITNYAVRMWFYRGIPRRYWKLLAGKLGVTPEVIAAANDALQPNA